jgi:FixJ family two-component response regulator
MSAPSASEPTVYVVDDDSSTRELLDWLMTRHGLQTALFPDARSFLAGYRTDLPGVLILDLKHARDERP